ncbi:hypothetical protein A7A08_00780 [Methyloligella halotolerans]|uniref:DUF2946 domain-containing protein n=1 Tax=Methyloligella halotolerans TaxID=1177755 RepID=A0A1E2S357_9HYPH|nr:DUF2946 family protein [Methyloligella halotolerans]ODA68946.1 hypothetical protein A7A08_00780 [Methyloligella halotolerans]
MQGWRNGTWRQIAGALGLLGVLVYSGLIPGHLISQLRNDLVQAKLGDALTLICHSSAPDGAVPAKQDGKSKTNCPFCKNLASFQFAATPPAAILLKRPGSRRMALPRETAIATFRDGQIPQSRGPPLLSV